MFYQKKKNIQNKYYTLFLRCNQVLVLVETPISLMVLFLHINIYNISSLYLKREYPIQKFESGILFIS